MKAKTAFIAFPFHCTVKITKELHTSLSLSLSQYQWWFWMKAKEEELTLEVAARGKAKERRWENCMRTYRNLRLRFLLCCDVVLATDLIPFRSNTFIKNWFYIFEFLRIEILRSFIFFDRQRRTQRLGYLKRCCLVEHCRAVKVFPRLSKTLDVNWDELWIRILCQRVLFFSLVVLGRSTNSQK